MIVNKILYYINILISLPFLILFYIFINIGYYFYNKSDNDNIRIFFMNISLKCLYFSIYLGIQKQIKYLNNTKINLNKITVINSNHVFSFDIFILFNLFFKNNINGSKLCSISTIKGINNFDKKILKLNCAALVNNTINDLGNIKNTISLLNKRNYNSILITFYEGKAKTDNSLFDSEYKHLLNPKEVAFDLINKNINEKYFYDINLVYTYNNKMKDFNNILQLFDPLTKIYVKIYKYPKNIDLYKLYEKKDKIIEEIILENKIS